MKYLISTMTLLSITVSAIAQHNPKGLSVGKMDPNFKGKDQNGKMITLQSALKKGPVVLLFYRGQWCPYCNKQLGQLQDSLMQITAKNAVVIAVTPEKPESIKGTVMKTKSSFSILHDENLKTMKQYDVAYEVNDATDMKLKSYGIDLMKNNGKNGKNLPVPAVYIIQTDGKITYKFFDADYTHRASVKEIVMHL